MDNALTAHTTNPVPFILVNEILHCVRPPGRHHRHPFRLMELEQPKEI